MNNLFSCLWFNEVHLLTPRDQLSFGYVVDRLKGAFKVFMFQNCEYNSLFELHPHIREHSSKIEWVKSLQELKGKGESLKESRGGFGLWTPYPGDLDSVELPKVVRTSKAGWASKTLNISICFCLIDLCGWIRFRIFLSIKHTIPLSSICRSNNHKIQIVKKICIDIHDQQIRHKQMCIVFGYKNRKERKIS